MVKSKVKLKRTPEIEKNILEGLDRIKANKYWRFMISHSFIDTLLEHKEGDKANVEVLIFGEKSKDNELLRQIKVFGERRGWANKLKKDAWKISKISITSFNAKSLPVSWGRNKITGMEGSYGKKVVFETILEHKKTLHKLKKFYMDSLVEYPYGDDKQRKIVARAILDKYKEFQNYSIPLSLREDFSWKDLRHIQIFKILQDWEKNNYFQIASSLVMPVVFFEFRRGTSLPDKLQGEFRLILTEKGIKRFSKYEPKTEGGYTDNKLSPLKEEITTLYLDKSGDLYREPKENYCYPMTEMQSRHSIVKYFAEKRIYKFYDTRQIAEALGKTPKTLRSDIGKINDAIKTKLKIKDKILEAKRKSGYRINPKYKIISIK